MNSGASYVIGVDFGTDSVRALLVDARDGSEIAAAVFAYPRWTKGLYCDPSNNQFRQHPMDYVEGLEKTIKACLEKAGPKIAASVRAISVDTTGSTPVAVNKQGVPLALTPGFEANPNAMFVLWKDHTALAEAEEINRHASGFSYNYLAYSGGIYSSEWYWAKALHILREDPAVQNEYYSWVEHCDWIPFLLTGGTSLKELKRSRCAAGHKALWARAHDGYPPVHWLLMLDPLLEKTAFSLPTSTYTADQPAGTLSAEWAAKLGLKEDVVIGIGAFDAHMGAVGGQIEPYHLSKVMGTSTCDILVTPQVRDEILVKGICGQVDGSVIPGMTGFEAGQSAFGDTYAWFVKLLSWPLQQIFTQPGSAEKSSPKPEIPAAKWEGVDQLQSQTLNLSDFADVILPALTEEAAKLDINDSDELAIDWLNGRRTPDADQNLKAVIAGLNLGSDAPRIFRALAEGTCFGARAIVERFAAEGIPIQGIIGIGGVAKKSPYIMQLMADILGMPIRIAASEQTCALGAAMFAAVAAGIHANIRDAMRLMGQGFDTTYQPRQELQAFYDRRYRKYQRLGYFIEEDRHEV